MLATRLLSEAKPVLLSGTEDGNDPFFSPDGQWIGFFAGGKMKKISVQGGAPVDVVRCARPPRSELGRGRQHRRGVEHPGRTFARACRRRNASAAHKVARGIGSPLAAVLPGGEAVLFTLSLSIVVFEDASIAAVSLKTGGDQDSGARGVLRPLPANRRRNGPPSVRA